MNRLSLTIVLLATLLVSLRVQALWSACLVNMADFRLTHGLRVDASWPFKTPDGLAALESTAGLLLLNRALRRGPFSTSCRLFGIPQLERRWVIFAGLGPTCAYWVCVMPGISSGRGGGATPSTFITYWRKLAPTRSRSFISGPRSSRSWVAMGSPHL